MDLRQPIAAVLQGLSSVSHGSNVDHIFSRVSVEHLHVKYDGRVYWRAGGGGGGKGKGESYGVDASPTKTEATKFYPPEYLLREAEVKGGKSGIAREDVLPWSWSQAAIFALGMLALHMKSGTSVISKGGNSIRAFIHYIPLLGFPPPFMIKVLNAVRLGPEERRGLEDIIKERNAMPLKGRCAKIMAGLSWNAQDFILKCLQWDPTKRITISEALKHSFITSHTNLIDTVHPAVVTALYKAASTAPPAGYDDEYSTAPVPDKSNLPFISLKEPHVRPLSGNNSDSMESGTLAWWEMPPAGLVMVKGKESAIYQGDINPSAKSMLDEELLQDISLLNEDGGCPPSILHRHQGTWGHARKHHFSKTHSGSGSGSDRLHGDQSKHFLSVEKSSRPSSGPPSRPPSVFDRVTVSKSPTSLNTPSSTTTTDNIHRSRHGRQGQVQESYNNIKAMKSHPKSSPPTSQVHDKHVTGGKRDQHDLDSSDDLHHIKISDVEDVDEEDIGIVRITNHKHDEGYPDDDSYIYDDSIESEAEVNAKTLESIARVSNNLSNLINLLQNPSLVVESTDLSAEMNALNNEVLGGLAVLKHNNNSAFSSPTTSPHGRHKHRQRDLVTDQSARDRSLSPIKPAVHTSFSAPNGDDTADPLDGGDGSPSPRSLKIVIAIEKFQLNSTCCPQVSKVRLHYHIKGGRSGDALSVDGIQLLSSYGGLKTASVNSVQSILLSSNSTGSFSSCKLFLTVYDDLLCTKGAPPIGTCEVDLSVLEYITCIDGWYHVVYDSGDALVMKILGQVKVTIRHEEVNALSDSRDGNNVSTIVYNEHESCYSEKIREWNEKYGSPSISHSSSQTYREYTHTHTDASPLPSAPPPSTMQPSSTVTMAQHAGQVREFLDSLRSGRRYVRPEQVEHERAAADKAAALRDARDSYLGDLPMVPIYSSPLYSQQLQGTPLTLPPSGSSSVTAPGSGSRDNIWGIFTDSISRRVAMG